MYQQLKSIIKNILPQKFLFAHEERFRQILLLFYKGKACRCNICGAELKFFEKLDNGNLLCPICGSLPRTRRLWKLLNDEFLRDGKVVLDFSPSRALYRKLKKNRAITYLSTDFENEFLADHQFNITAIDSASGRFDLIICYHILEHVPEDHKAMDELYRVLKSGGNLLVQTPFKEGSIYEDSSVKTPADREKHFGQKDHVRIYSVEGLQKRLESAGFKTEIRQFQGDNYHGLSDEERVLVCTK